ncbi:DinB family protein [Chitinophaga skermanii]|uniref:DinB family protein n=1 Tax=Chitinophaga skermanii TaxID=331697 RepID=A0A327QRF2_9BACT|nr:DinB family protein [Chitinophaga skermanii]RAJ06821.1 DinB family protein [Chitinophaga skermanii]
MNNLLLMAESLQHLYNGQPWLDVTVMEHLSGMDEHQALRRLGDSHNTWELVNHLIFWHQNVIRKLSGEPTMQDGDLPDFYVPENTHEENWQATLHRLHHSFEMMVNTIQGYPPHKLYDVITGTQHTAYYYIQGVVSHTAYHLGQIVLLHKYATQ